MTIDEKRRPFAVLGAQTRVAQIQSEIDQIVAMFPELATSPTPATVAEAPPTNDGSRRLWTKARTEKFRATMARKRLEREQAIAFPPPFARQTRPRATAN